MAKKNNDTALNPLPWNSYKDLPVILDFFRHLNQKLQETAMQLSIPAESAKSNIKFATLMAFPHGAACRAARAAIGFHGCQLS